MPHADFWEARHWVGSAVRIVLLIEANVNRKSAIKRQTVWNVFTLRLIYVTKVESSTVGPPCVFFSEITSISVMSHLHEMPNVCWTMTTYAYISVLTTTVSHQRQLLRSKYAKRTKSQKVRSIARCFRLCPVDVRCLSRSLGGKQKGFF